MTAEPAHMPAERLPPPTSTVGPLAWLRQNLFAGPLSSLVTLVFGALLLLIAVVAVNWVVNEARWGVITSNLRLFLIGLYPADEAWRPWLALGALSLVAGLTA
jgi:general L-amino acid transport system permease protein